MTHIFFFFLALALTICPVQRSSQWLPARHQEGGTKGSQLLKSMSGWEWTWPEQDLRDAQNALSWVFLENHNNTFYQGEYKSVSKQYFKNHTQTLGALHGAIQLPFHQVNFSNFGYYAARCGLLGS